MMPLPTAAIRSPGGRILCVDPTHATAVRVMHGHNPKHVHAPAATQILAVGYAGRNVEVTGSGVVFIAADRPERDHQKQHPPHPHAYLSHLTILARMGN